MMTLFQETPKLPQAHSTASSAAKMNLASKTHVKKGGLFIYVTNFTKGIVRLLRPVNFEGAKTLSEKEERFESSRKPFGPRSSPLVTL